ncbi:short-chain dehydrogenase/reductase family 16C member 6-like [Vespa velutina]|uniref:short-chain dehydrogenase/reductase family 16C member 6-like n=1 Tax=Vespa velutina TaxID=202808 RepID=UPI001FB3E14A|nr:short-chain dehydrogenase/reductase family 16C member 6-like [Vespa velutina]
MWNIRPLMNTIMFTFMEIIRNIMKIFIPLQYRMENISGEIALITGAAESLGRALALSLVNHGAIVVIWDINQKDIFKVLKYVSKREFNYTRNRFNNLLFAFTVNAKHII